MAALHDLIEQISDSILRARIQKETDKLTKNKKFGLVFEEHIPEVTALYDIPVQPGCLAMKKNSKEDKTIYTVLSIDDSAATCVDEKETMEEPVAFPVADIVRIVEFGQPIYPYLQKVDSVCNAPDSDLWHTLIEADNYHALQLLEYLYAGKVDCIYIDPPYNKENAKDWKYNCNYVDSNDQYKHSKWLSMMERRLKLAKKLLKADDSVLIVTIDETEYLHLGCLLEELFPEANIQMITDVVNPRGTNRDNEFSRVEEFLFVCKFGNSVFTKTENNMLGNTDEVSKGRVWFGFNRGNNLRNSANKQFYPIYINKETKEIIKIGEPLSPNAKIEEFPQYDGLTAVFPINDKKQESIWRGIPSTVSEWVKKGYVKVNKYDENVGRWTLSYIPSGIQKKIESGEITVNGKNSDGSINIDSIENPVKLVSPKTVWKVRSHNATDYGASLIKSILPNRIFSYPKSIYSVHDILQFFISDKKNALIVDFFAGSGTTLHAVNLLNAEDDGHRQCIMVTNNEVSESEEKALTKQGYHQGDPEWEKYGIARYVTWPRTVCSIEGHDINGQPLKGDYGIETETYEPDDEVQVISAKTGKPTKKTVYRKAKRQLYPKLASISMSDGFKANAVYFKLGFLDKDSVALGRQFRELLPVFWMKAGAIGPCPSVDGGKLPYSLVLPENGFAVLLNHRTYSKFVEQVSADERIKTVYIVTDSESEYKAMLLDFEGRQTYQIYRDYLDNFRINTGDRI